MEIAEGVCDIHVVAVVVHRRLVGGDSRARRTAGPERRRGNDWRIPGGEHFFEGRTAWEIGNEIAIFVPTFGRTGHGDLEGYRLQISSRRVINDGAPGRQLHTTDRTPSNLTSAR